jgi:peroxiredoxin
VVFVGVAIDEAQNVQSFADETGINYPILLGGTEGVELSSKVGNRLGGLPYTAIIDRQGNIVSTKVGGLSRAELESALRGVL